MTEMFTCVAARNYKETETEKSASGMKKENTYSMVCVILPDQIDF